MIIEKRVQGSCADDPWHCDKRTKPVQVQARPNPARRGEEVGMKSHP